MAQNSMAGDFIQNMLALMQMRQQAEQFRQSHALQEQNSQANVLQLLTMAAQNFPNRTEALKFVDPIGTMFNLPPEALLALAQGQSPTEAAIRGGAASQGRAAMTTEQLGMQNNEAASAVTTGMNTSQSALSSFLANAIGNTVGPSGIPQVRNMLGEAGFLRMLTGMSPGQFSLDQATHNLQPEQLNQAAQISTGLALSAPQIAGNALTARGQDLSYSATMAGNRLGWARLAQEGELGYLQLAMQGQLALAQSSGRSGLTVGDIPELVAIQNTLTENLGKAQTPAARQQFMSGLGTVNSLLNSLGVPTPQVDPVGDVNQFNTWRLFQPSTWGNRTTLPMYVPQTPEQQQMNQQGYQNLMGNNRPFTGTFGFP